MAERAQDGPVWFEHEPTAEFGPSVFHAPGRAIPFQRLDATGTRAIRAGIRQLAPRQPGVYAMLDPRDRIIYVGKAKNLRSRLLSYVRRARPTKAGKIIRHTRSLIWEQVPDEFAAFLRELELIRRHRPRFNVLGQPDNARYVYVCIGRNPGGYVYFNSNPKGKQHLAIYGPLRGRGRISDAVRRVNLHFGLRDCANTVSLSFADQADIFPDARHKTAQCLRHELGTCLAPCIASCTQDEYSTALRAAKAFLDGNDDSILTQTQAEMTAAAAAMHYERAAVLRDKYESLNALSQKLLFLRNARRNNSFIYPLRGTDGSTTWYMIHGGEVRATALEPQNPEQAKKVLVLIQAIFQSKYPGIAVLERCVDSVWIVTSWFRRSPTEHAKLMSSTQAAERCSAMHGSGDREVA